MEKVLQMFSETGFFLKHGLHSNTFLELIHFLAPAEKFDLGAETWV